MNYRREVQATLGGPQGLFVVERQLRQMIGMPVIADRLIRPVDPAVDARFVFDHDTLVGSAMANRTELARQSLRVRQEELRLIAAKNFLLPQLDMIGRYRARGFGDDLTGDAGRDRFASAYRDLLSGDHQEFEFGVEMGVVAGRRQARAGVRHASLQIQRERAILAEQQRSVRHQISDAHAEVESAYASMETSLAQVERKRLAWPPRKHCSSPTNCRSNFCWTLKKNSYAASCNCTPTASVMPFPWSTSTPLPELCWPIWESACVSDSHPHVPRSLRRGRRTRQDYQATTHASPRRTVRVF